jgi:type IV secretion system protein TrbI
MAATEKRLTMHPVPQATRYNRLVQYGLCGAGALIVLTYLTVMSSRGEKPQWERPDRFVTINRPLITDVDVEKPPPPLPLPPQLPLELPPQTFAQPTAAPPARAASPAHPNPDVERRKEALLKAMTAKVLVEEFSRDRQAHAPTSVALPSASSQSGSPPFAHLAPPWPSNPTPAQMHAWTPPHATVQPTTLVGRSHDFWQQSSHATTEQYLAASVQPPRSPYQVNAGTIVPAVLTQAITSDLEGTVTAQVSHDVYDSVTGRYLLIPQGARLFGVYDADLRANQPRLQLAFKTLYFPNGYSLSLQGMPGMDSRGFAGLSDQVNRHFFQRYGTAAVFSFITAGISLATYGSRDRFYAYEPQDAATYSAGQVLGRAVAEDLRQAMRIRPTVTVREAYPFTLTVTQDVTFPGVYPFALQVAQGGTQ